MGVIGTLNSATVGGSTFPLAARHFNNLTPGSLYTLLGRKIAPVTAMLAMGMGGDKLGISSQGVNDKKYDDLTDHPAITNFLVRGYDAAGAANAAITTATTTFTIKDPTGTVTDPRSLLQVGDQLILHSAQSNSDGVQTTADGTVAASGEVWEVASLGNSTYFTATRNIGSVAATGNVACDDGDYLLAKLLMPADEEATRSREALSHAMQSQYNYIQNFHESFEITKDLWATLLAGGPQWPRDQERAFVKFMNRLEWTLIAGKRHLRVVDSAKYQTQGWLSTLTGDAAAAYGVYTAANDLLTGNHNSRIWKIGSPNNLTPQNWMRAMSYVYSEGGENKVAVCGQGFMIQLTLAFEGYWVLPIPSISSQGFDINLTLSGIRTPDGVCRIVTHKGFDGPYENDCIILDLDYLGIKKFDGGSYDVGEPHIWLGKNNDGLEDNDSTTKKAAWAGQMGAHMLYKDAHAYFFGMENPNGTLGGRYGSVGTQTPSTTTI